MLPLPKLNKARGGISEPAPPRRRSASSPYRYVVHLFVRATILRHQEKLLDRKCNFYTSLPVSERIVSVSCACVYLCVTGIDRSARRKKQRLTCEWERALVMKHVVSALPLILLLRPYVISLEGANSASSRFIIVNRVFRSECDSGNPRYPLLATRYSLLATRYSILDVRS